MTVIAIAHQKGGVGKSTVAINLAIELNADRIIDTDRQTSITKLQAFRADYPKARKLTIITTPSEDELMSIFDNDSDDQLTVVDTGGFDSQLNRLIVAYADLIVTPVNDSQLELAGLIDFSELVAEISEAAGREIKPYVLLNKMHHSKRDFSELSEFVEETPSLELFDSVIRDRKDHKDSAGFCLAAKEYKPYSDAARDFKSLGFEIKALISRIMLAA